MVVGAILASLRVVLGIVACPSYLENTNQGFPNKLNMIKRFPSRNNRSKGIKVKHVLQIVLLLGVCFWLIYQVKHNHDKKNEFAKDAKLSVSTQTDPILKLGRRDLHPGKHEEIQNEKHEEEEEDEHIEEDEETKHDHEEQQDGNKHETEEREENKHEGRQQRGEENKHGAEDQEEDEGRGGGDDDIDENDQEKSEMDTTDRDDEFLDEEKEKEEVDEKENENEDEEKESLVENHNNHEAREEHYKGDDASSAVAHDTHATNTETETLSLENSDVNLEMNITKPENETTYSDESVRKQNDSDLKVSEGNVIDGISSNATAVQETGNNTLSNPVDDSSFLNKTTATDSDSHFQSSSNLTVVTTEASNNLTLAGNDTSSSSEQNKTVMLSESDQAQNSTTNTTIPGDVKNVQTEGLEQSGNRTSDENLHDTNSTISIKTENGGEDAGESSNLVASNVTENAYRNERSESDISESDKSNGNTETNENPNVDATEDEMFKGDTQTGETDETSDSSSANETMDSAEQDAIDSSDTHIHEDVAEARTDLDTLPDIRNEGDDSDETAAE
ncbi:hypothetical protein HKD37_20G056946 [Glycine soja]